jgi:uncharacterized protein (DUF362 family)
VNGNFNVAYPGSNTSPWFLKALLSVMRDRGFAVVTVVEGDLPEFRAESMARSTGLLETLGPFAVPFLSYEALPRDPYELPAVLSEVQLINAPVFHTHGQAVISCATKNLFGLLPRDRRKYHRCLSEKLLELAERVPCATLVDGTVGLEGESTRRGDPVRCDLLLSGGDVLALDVVAAKVMGFTVDQVPLLEMARAAGKLRPHRVEIAGDFSMTTVPTRAFRLEVGKVRRIANLVAELPWNLEPIHRVADIVRVAWHRVNYFKKKRQLAEGPWQEYAR